MNYSKPEIALVASASLAIQGQPKAASTTADNQGTPFTKTVAAYEADE